MIDLKPTAFLVTSLLIFSGATEVGASPVLQPHVAAYTFRLVTARSGGSVTDASGRMTFELTDACRGWTSAQKTSLDLGFSSGGSVTFGWSNSTYEAKDGSSFRFFVEQFSEAGDDEKQSGKAKIKADGSGGVAEIEENGEIRAQELPRGTLFPSAFTVKLIDAARSGEVILSGPLFDGSGEKGVYDVSLVIGKHLPPGTAASVEGLENLESWQVRAAFYSVGDRSSVPDQEQSFRLYENGVIDRLQLDMGDFVVEGLLSDYETQNSSDC
ncbi:DUF1849 family protein [Limibacillus sp. MBR-115]|uniref:EipB family protein n=1 Tax=Limibacillus sp. MBR-115 TaxID=3156465 RepID=UPI0033975A19